MHLRSGGKQAKLKELSNNISDRSKAKGTGIMSDLLLVNGEARQLVANPHYTILLRKAKLGTAIENEIKEKMWLGVR